MVCQVWGRPRVPAVSQDGATAGAAAGKRRARVSLRDALGAVLSTPLLVIPLLLPVAAVGFGLAVAPTSVSAKTPGKTYCFYGRCHRVRTIEETRRAVGKRMVVKASFYFDAGKDRFNPSNVTSSGEYFRSGKPDNAASPIWPDGTLLLVWNPATKSSVVVRVNNAGPYWGQRMLDVSRGAAEKLGFARHGVATLHTKVLAAPTAAEARYRRGRTYPPAPGFIGVFQSIELALAQAARAIGGAVAGPAATVPSKPVTVAAAGSAAMSRGANSRVKTTTAVSRKQTRTAGLTAAKPDAPSATESKTDQVAAATGATGQPVRALQVARSAARLAVAGRSGSATKVKAVRVAARTGRQATTGSGGKVRGKARGTSSSRRKSAATVQEKVDRPGSRRTDRGKRTTSRGATARRAAAAARDDDDEDAKEGTQSAGRRSAASRAVARPASPASSRRRPVAMRAPPSSGPSASGFKSSRCYGWPSFCGRDEG